MDHFFENADSFILRVKPVYESIDELMLMISWKIRLLRKSIIIEELEPSLIEVEAALANYANWLSQIKDKVDKYEERRNLYIRIEQALKEYDENNAKEYENND